MKSISVIDSHTGGEPTRLIVANGPDLGSGPLDMRVKKFRQSFDHLRTAVIGEPRGSEAMVGGLICKPCDPTHSAGIMFFDGAGFLGMCGHGTIGLLVTLKHLGRIDVGEHLIETPVGVIAATLIDDHTVRVRNVPSYRARQNVEVDVAGFGIVVGDIAWGGNWFFIVNDCKQSLTLERVEELLGFTKAIRRRLRDTGICGEDGTPIEHIELHCPSENDGIDSRNFVLCPGGSYDRSPCGTGTSARMACLAADGKLHPGQLWRQESILGSVFEGCVEQSGNRFVPSFQGSAHVSGETTLIMDAADPFRFGIRQ